MSFQFLSAFFSLLIISGIQIYWIINLQKKFNHKFLSYFLFSIASSCVYGLINFGGKQLNSELFSSDIDIIVVNQIMTTIALPFLMLSFYFLLLFYTELRGGKCFGFIKIAFWVSQLIAFGVYIWIVSALLEQKDEFKDYYLFYYLSNTQLIVVLSIFLGNLFLAQKVKAKKQKQFISVVILVDLACFLLTFILLEKIDLSRYFSPVSFYTFISSIYFLTNFFTIWVVSHYLKTYSDLYLSVKSNSEKDLLKLESYNITDREKEIIELLISGLTNDEIAERLFISPQTVKNNLTTIYKKTNVRNRVELRNLFN